jgi:hypothetical protein
LQLPAMPVEEIPEHQVQQRTTGARRTRIVGADL